MTSISRMIFSLLLVVHVCASTEGQTVLFDFESGLDDFIHFGTTTVDSGLLSDCGVIGNNCATHTGNFTEKPFSPNEFGLGELGPFFGPTSIDLSGFIGYKIDARFVRTGIDLVLGQTAFTGLSPISFGVQWDTTDTCSTSLNACSDLFDAPVELTEDFQTYTVLFSDFITPGTPLNAAAIKMIMFTGEFDPNSVPPTKIPGTDWSDGVGRLEFDNIIGILVPEPVSISLTVLCGVTWLAFSGRIVR